VVIIFLGRSANVGGCRLLTSSYFHQWTIFLADFSIQSTVVYGFLRCPSHLQYVPRQYCISSIR
jgi:hypothetical protein